MIVFVMAGLCGACAENETPKVVEAIHQSVAGKAPAHASAAAWTDTQEFYKRRDYAPVWVMDEQMRADTAMQLVSSAKTHGLDPAAYGEEDLIKARARLTSEDAPEKGTDERVRSLADTDVRITSALLSLGRDIALGRTRPERVDPRWKAHRDAPDFVGKLNTATEIGLNTWLDTIKPTHPQ